jgi:predicted CopG family antitoxin
MKTEKSFEKLIDTLLNKDVVKEKPPKQESFQEFIDKMLGKK